jgi:hypothetical protein
MKILVTFLLALLSFQTGFSQSTILPYAGISFANLQGQTTEPVPLVLIINSEDKTSKGFLIGLTYLRLISDNSSLGLSIYTQSFRAKSSVSRALLPPESIKFREITLVPLYEHNLLKEKLKIFLGPQLTMLTGHKEVYVRADGTEFESKFSARDNFLFGGQVGLRVNINSIWVGASLSVPFSFRYPDRYRDYLSEYSSFSLRAGYSFQL